MRRAHAVTVRDAEARAALLRATLAERRESMVVDVGDGGGKLTLAQRDGLIRYHKRP